MGKLLEDLVSKVGSDDDDDDASDFYCNSPTTVM
jgi:hypothetical protein